MGVVGAVGGAPSGRQGLPDPSAPLQLWCQERNEVSPGARGVGDPALEVNAL